MGSMGRARRAVLFGVMAATSAACAQIWGFQDAVDAVDGAADATAGGDAQADGVSSEVGEDVIEDRRIGESGADAADSGSGADAADSGSDDGATPGLDAGDGAVDVNDASPDAPDADMGACSAVCVPAPQAGWEGPLEIFEGSGQPLPTPPTCTGAYATDIYDGVGVLDAGAAACTCACGSVTARTCASPVIDLFSDTSCVVACGPPNQAIDASCTTLGVAACPPNPHFKLQPGSSSGTCVADASAAVPPPTWEANTRLCAPEVAPTGAGCDVGQVCAPRTGLPFVTDVYCVAQAGLPDCPSGYPTLRTYYLPSLTDNRGCTACTCGAATGIACTATLSSSNHPNCSGGGSQTQPSPQACASLNGMVAMTLNATSAVGGACAPAGGQPTGSAAPSTPTTVCCTQ
jgi:hypothetical protein